MIVLSINPACLINILLAFFALSLYIAGSYRFYRSKNGFILLLSLAIAIDIITAILASFKITPTTPMENLDAVPWYSLLFKVHVTLSTIGIFGFIFLFIYILSKRKRQYSQWIRKWQFKLLLPVWVIGEGIALANAISKLFFKVRIFELL